MRWETENYNPPSNRRVSKTTILALVVLVIAVLGVVAMFPYMIPPPVPPPPQKTTICLNSDENCFSSQLRASQTNGAVFNLKWEVSDGSVYSNSVAPTVNPSQIEFDNTTGILGIRLSVVGVSKLNVSSIIITDMNFVTRLGTFTCQHLACEVSSRILYFQLQSDSINMSSLFEFRFNTSGNVSVWRITFHA